MSDAQLEKYKKIYDQIISFYELAEKLIDCVDDKDTKDPSAMIDFVEPLVEGLEKSTDVLASEYRNFISSGKRPNILARKKIQKAILDIENVRNSAVADHVELNDAAEDKINECKRNLQDVVEHFKEELEVNVSSS